MDDRRPATPLADLLDGLDDTQHAAVTSDARVVRILAGAGSGKTRVLTRRIAHRAATGDADPRRILALTFTRRAATELEQRIGSLGIHDAPTAGTFHGVAFAQLRSWWADRGKVPPRLVQHKASFVRRVLGPDEAPHALSVAHELDWAAARLVDPSAYAATMRRLGRRTPLPPDRIASVIEAYTAEKRRRGVVDFDDLLALCTRALVADRAFGEAQRWRFQHVFVDEFQDLNPLQFRLLRAWLPPDGEADLCVVGDPNQAIYGWNGADNRYLARFDELFPGAATVRLDRNYRSSPHVIAAATAVLGPAGAQRAVRPVGPPPTVTSHADEHAEAAGVATAVREAARVPGRAWSAQAVLVRTHAQGVVIGAALEAAGIPVRLRTRPDASEPDRGDDADGPRGRPATEQPREEAVEVVTFHAAKGLEWPVVHVAGVEDGLVPHFSAVGAEAVEEERRLLYVAVTRAERELHLSWARSRSFRGRAHERRPSPWLEPVEQLAVQLGAPAATTPAPAVPSVAGATAPRHHRAPPTSVPPAGAEPATIVEELHAWRDTQARAARVPPQVVMSDVVLAAIAAAAPRDTEELAAVTGVGPVRATRFGPALLAIVAGDTVPAPPPPRDR